MPPRRRVGRAWALTYLGIGLVALLAALVLGTRWLPAATIGDIDPLGAPLALVGLAFGVWALYLSVQAWRWQQTDLTDLAGRLAEAVRAAETRARDQLLGGHDRTIDIEFELTPAPAHDAANAAPRGRLAEVLSYYDDLRPRRMVITGEPGSGKTVLALELILGLLEHRGPDDPVPLRLSAASWSTDTAESVEEWLTAHLTEAYGLSWESARALVQAQRVLPVIDGLDEMDADPTPGYTSRAALALRALNRYQQSRGKADMVLTCRSGEYESMEAAKVWAEDSARIRILPVDATKARRFVEDRVLDAGRWAAVLDTVEQQPGSALAGALSTPWRLTLAVIVYEQREPETGDFVRDPDDLCDPALDDPDAIRDHLLAQFVPAVLAADRTPPERYSAERVHRWLAVLARYLNDNAATNRQLGGRTLSGTDVVLHELWPLAGDRLVRGTVIGTLVVVWLAALPIMLGRGSIGYVLPLTGVEVLYAWVAYQVIWSQPERLDFSALRAPRRRHAVIVRLLTFSGLGLAVGFLIGLLTGLMLSVLQGTELDPVFGGLMAVAGVAIGCCLALTADGTVGVTDPRSPALTDFVNGAAVAIAISLTLHFVSDAALAPGSWSPAFNGASGLVFGSAYAASGLSPGGGRAGTRYLALLLCTRRRSGRWLPWRLGRFLDWCYRSGLVRIAGHGYQFRHREVQDYLAAHPTP